ncbi:MAG TPA: NBR1-Ig-like domain-containing protein [Anaerolineales bacterium]|nr:NBR1-Ig-like domain-containing protein [Anaerolineales bacterium]
MNTKKTILFITLALMLLASSACGSATETADPNQVNAVNTGIAETAQSAVNATLTRIALSNPSDTPTPVFTETTIPTATTVFTATSSKPMISVSKTTNCRLGPDVVYDRVGQLDPGVMVEVFGVDPSKSYYYIENPNNPGTYCWVWGYYATEVNDFTGVPVKLPGPTPTPGKTATPGGSKTPTVTGTITNVGACTTDSLSPLNNSKFKPGTLYIDFTWVVKNTSQTTWDDANVDFKFMNGTNLHDYSVVNLSGDVLPDAKATLLLDLNIPNSVGKYTETWAVVQGATTFCSVTLTIEVAN